MNNQRQYIAILLVLFLTAINNVTQAATYYDFKITEGLVETSGGFAGSGYGDFDLIGNFGITFTDSSVSFSNISISSTAINYFEFPSFDGQFDNGTITGDTGPYNNSTGRITYNGYFDGSILTLSGADLAPCCDQYNHAFTLTASVSPVPLPASIWLFISGLGVLQLFKSRKNI